VYTYFKSAGFPFDKDYLGHNGALAGYATWMLFDPQTGIGVCLFSNGDIASSNSDQTELVTLTVASIENYLFQVFNTCSSGQNNKNNFFLTVFVCFHLLFLCLN
jgi:CubicO group peptidase (beta-lactamase class C family)